MRNMLAAAVLTAFAAPLCAQTLPANMDELGSGMTGRAMSTDTTEVAGRLAPPKTAGDATVAGSARMTTGDPKIHAMSEQRRGDAVKLADMVRKGAQVPADYGAKLREAIDGDMELWRDEYKVSAKSFKEARRQWLDGASKMDANTLAILRAELFGARDQYNAAVR